MPNILLLLVNRMKLQNSVFNFLIKMMNFVILLAITFLNLYYLMQNNSNEKWTISIKTENQTILKPSIVPEYNKAPTSDKLHLEIAFV